MDININDINIENLTNYELIDIREEDEIKNWPSLKSSRHIPFSEFPYNINEFNKNDSYLLFCARCGRSHAMAEALIKKGYKALSINNGIASLNAYLKKLNS
ncbi:MAG: rhodanese-like domain-containing protein [Candidatus Omnitrophota bacterium]